MGAVSEFLNDILDLVALYDDLIDLDQPVTDADIHAGMWIALVKLPRNAFYAANFAVLNPIVMNAISNWRVANQMEAEAAPVDLPVSYVIRSSYADLFSMCALIIAGPDFAQKVGLEVRRAVHDEWADYQVKGK